MDHAKRIAPLSALEQALAGYRLRSGELTQPLTRTEREVLRVLGQAAGKPVSRDEILRKIWGGETDVESGNVDNIVARLRRKLRVVGESPQLIQTVRGLGYRWATASDLPESPSRHMEVDEALPPLKEFESRLVHSGDR